MLSNYQPCQSINYEHLRLVRLGEFVSMYKIGIYSYANVLHVNVLKPTIYSRSITSNVMGQGSILSFPMILGMDFTGLWNYWKYCGNWGDRFSPWCKLQGAKNLSQVFVNLPNNAGPQLIYAWPSRTNSRAMIKLYQTI